MILVKPSANIASDFDGIAALRTIEGIGRISHASEDAQTETSYERFIRSVVLDHGDWSIVEHVSASVVFVVDRGISHELVRHRLASYTQSSTRFINYVKKMPPAFVKPVEMPPSVECAWENAINTSEAAYKSMIEAGVAPQIARSVFPNALATKVVMTCNLRNWRHFLLMRTTKETHPQMREVTIPLLARFKKAVPLLFDDIESGQRQADNLKKAR